MKEGRGFHFAVAVLGLGVGLAHGQTPLGTAFTYQGHLEQDGSPVTSACDFEFSLWNDPVLTDTVANQVGSTLVFDGVVPNPAPIAVAGGVFTVSLDYGATVFNGEARWLQISVACPSGDAPATLSPRQPVTAAPYALQTRGLFVDDAGNVGIPTTAPLSPLQLSNIGNWRWDVGNGWGDLSLSNGSVGLSFGVATVGGGTGDVRMWTRGGTERLIIGNPTVGDILTVEGDGQVGIGTTQPTRKLHVVETQASTLTYPLKIANESDQILTGVGALFQVDGGGDRGKGAIAYELGDTWNRGTFHFLQDSNPNADIADFGDSVMQITNGGDVGIGTTAPDRRLHVEDTQPAALSYALKLSNNSSSVGTAVGSLFQAGATTASGKGAIVYENKASWNRGSFHILQDPSATALEPTLANAVVTVTNQGRMGIGTTSPAANLHVADPGDGVTRAAVFSGSVGIDTTTTAAQAGLRVENQFAELCDFGFGPEVRRGPAIFATNDPTSTEPVSCGDTGVIWAESSEFFQPAILATSIGTALRVVGGSFAAFFDGQTIFNAEGSSFTVAVNGQLNANGGVKTAIIATSDGAAIIATGSEAGIFNGSTIFNAGDGAFVAVNGPLFVHGGPLDVNGDADVSGNLNIQGTLTKGGGSFKIDHPLDPENKYLSHSFVESPDMMNIYNGNVVTDQKGFASVELPEWFEALNRDFRYQLTVVDTGDSDDFVQAKVVRKIEHNRFAIRTSAPRTEVSWQVTGVRQDAYANANRIPVESQKAEHERGTYLHAEAWGKPAAQSLAKVRRQQLAHGSLTGKRGQQSSEARAELHSTRLPGVAAKQESCPADEGW